MDKVFCIVAIGRQMEGEMVVVRFEKAYTRLSKAEEEMQKLPKTAYREIIETPNGGMEFVIERGIHEIEVEE